ncbi:hypothetical protein ACFLSJ_01110 [Verrucomicrobiota bacterium]
MSAYPVTTRGSRDYLGNKSKKEVHDLKNEQRNCQIDEILRAGNAMGFSPDTLTEAHSCGYDNCAYCIGGSTR